MMKVKWALELDGEVHMVEAEHGDYSGRKQIMLDGNVIHDSGAVVIDRGLEHTFYINAHTILIKIVSNTFTFEYYCHVDGTPIDAVADAEINGAEIAWTFDDAEGDSHQVELKHGARERAVLLDGREVYKKGGFFSVSSPPHHSRCRRSTATANAMPTPPPQPPPLPLP
eukprot:SAG11_NODE_4103_length_2063_cov_2.553971_1_plen_169_part_00